MRAICNTTAAISPLHHQPGNVKLETYCLSGQSCTDAIAGDALTYCVKFVMKCRSIIYIFVPFYQEMIGKDATLTFFAYNIANVAADEYLYLPFSTDRVFLEV